MTTAKLLAMAEQARDLAMQQHQPAAAVSAIQAIAKLSGLWIERVSRRRSPATWTRYQTISWQASFGRDSPSRCLRILRPIRS